MSNTVLTVEDAAARLSELVEHVSVHPGSAVILKSGNAMARLVPCPPEAAAATDLIAFLRQWRREHPEPDDSWATVLDESNDVIQPAQNVWE